MFAEGGELLTIGLVGFSTEGNKGTPTDKRSETADDILNDKMQHTVNVVQHKPCIVTLQWAVCCLGVCSNPCSSDIS